jgi:hypothetical protein
MRGIKSTMERAAFIAFFSGAVLSPVAWFFFRQPGIDARTRHGLFSAHRQLTPQGKVVNVLGVILVGAGLALMFVELAQTWP